MNLPSRVELTADTMILHWPGAAAQRIAHRTLRDACPCAGCRRLRSAAGPNGTATQVYDVAVTEIRPMGYGVQLVFSDAHDRGIFPWPYLQALPAIESAVAGLTI